jgi:hypothetical protein
VSYIRVIPRDLFNEANLLKCLGQLYIKIDSVGLSHIAQFSEESVSEFRIVQDESDGSIFVGNLQFWIRDKFYHLSRPLNSRQPWPLYISRGDDTFPVFDDDGTLSIEMIRLLNGKRA